MAGFLNGFQEELETSDLEYLRGLLAPLVIERQYAWLVRQFPGELLEAWHQYLELLLAATSVTPQLIFDGRRLLTITLNAIDELPNPIRNSDASSTYRQKILLSIRRLYAVFHEVFEQETVTA